MEIDEYFAAIDGYPNYVVSSLGRVVNILFDRDITPTTDGKGFLKVRLYHEGVVQSLYLHRVVAKAFFLNYDEDREVLLIENNKEDCSVGNITIGLRLKGGGFRVHTNRE